MAPRKPKVVVTRKLPDAVETRMRELFDTELNLDDVPMDAEALSAAMDRAEVLACTITDRIDAELIGRAGDQLKLIANFGVGVDHIDVAAAHARGITVTNTPGVLTEDTADLTMGLILAAARRVVEGANIVQAGEFHGWSPTWMLGRRLWGKRLGIVGMGRIGQALARRARAFGLAIHYHNRKPVSPRIAEELEATYWESLDQMLARMDVVSRQLPAHAGDLPPALGPAAEAAAAARHLIVNTARGEIIDEAALADMLAARRAGRRGPRRLRARAGDQPQAAEAAQRRPAAAHELGHHRGPDRHGREGDHQHPHLDGRPQAAGPGDPVDALGDRV